MWFYNLCLVVFIITMVGKYGGAATDDHTRFENIEASSRREMLQHLPNQ